MSDNKKYWKLPKERGELWLEALRSGEYSQCKSRLHEPNVGYCCLGVFAKVNFGDEFTPDHFDDGGLSDFTDKLEPNSPLLADTSDSMFEILTSFNDMSRILSSNKFNFLPEVKFHNKTMKEGINRVRDFNFIANFIEKYVEFV